MNIVILAAGQGKRMRSALPKVLQPLAGKPLLAHVIAAAQKLGPKRLVVVIGHGAESVRQHFAEQAAGQKVEFALQEQQLGTGHAVAQAMPLLADSSSTLILYGDVPLIRPDTLQSLLGAAGETEVGLLTVKLPDPSGYGRIVRDASHNVTRIVEHKDANEAELAISEINTGILCAPTVELRHWLSKLKNSNAQGEYYLTDIIAMAVADGIAVNTVHPHDRWEVEGVNDKKQLAELERAHQKAQATALMTQGVTVIDPARIDVRGTLTCGADVEIDVNCIFEGNVQLADGVKIGANCIIKNASIGAGSIIAPFTHIADSTVGAGVDIGPFARLRPGNVVEDKAHIGNFVELKNTRMGKGAKAGHLAYLGDAVVGENVNYGAGSITANYDGANKHQTTIGAGVHVGSNSVLVAPVTIGEGATIGAGSVIGKDAPAGKLTVARAKQMSIEGWVRPVKTKK
jgi:bifunctional UDP-N-acetylglucosamine pyrophosphorylase / glucosamine-1-phosphate N-acetyltransferase